MNPAFHTLSDFIAMGGHGPFVWSAYALSFVIIVFNFIRPVMLKRRNAERLRQEMNAKQEN